MAPLDVGKPFSPLMFDGVLKSFTPDLPSGISGRPRFVDALTISFYFNAHLPSLVVVYLNVAIDTIMPFLCHYQRARNYTQNNDFSLSSSFVVVYLNVATDIIMHFLCHYRRTGNYIEYFVIIECKKREIL